MRIKFHARSDRGRKRPLNQDAFAVSDDLGFCILCDGMGGHRSGEVASRMAVEMLGEAVRRARAGGLGAESGLAGLVHDWLRAANEAIYRRGTRERGAAAGKNMGTTLALLLLASDGLAVVAHVGDSRVYRLRDGRLERLTADHSVTGPVDGADPGPRGRKRRYVTRALGTRPVVVPDVGTVDVRARDRFVVCSDGLTDLVRDEEIAAALLDRLGELHNAPRALINLANERGGRDNITVIVAAVEPDAAPEEGGAAAAFAAPPPLEPPPPLDPPPPWESSD